MERAPELNSYIYYLLSQDESKQSSRRSKGVYMRRRTMQYSIAMENSLVAGYEWRNPLTNHNYAYQTRIVKELYEGVDGALKKSALFGLATIVAQGLWLYRQAGWRTALGILGAGAAVVEFRSQQMESNFRNKFKTLQDLQDQLSVNIQDPNHPEADLVKRFYHDDVEYAAGALWHMNQVDNIKTYQGLSGVSNAGGMAVLLRFFFANGMKLPAGWLIAFLVAVTPILDSVYQMVNMGDRFVDGASMAVSHFDHVLGWVVGLVASYIAP